MKSFNFFFRIKLILCRIRTIQLRIKLSKIEVLHNQQFFEFCANMLGKKKARSGYKRKRAKVFFTKGMDSRKPQRPSTALSISANPASTLPPIPPCTISSEQHFVPDLHAPTASTPLSSIPVAVPTKSSKKIALARSAAAFQPKPSPAQPEDNRQDYHLIRISSLMRAVGAFTCCGSSLTVTENRTSRRGLVTKISICCSVCGQAI